MKRFGFLLLVALLTAGAISAQNRGNPWGVSQSVTANGTLQLQNGLIVVADGTTVYFVPVLERYIGFIDGLKEGARVSVEGYLSGNYIQPSKVTINGKSYDFPVNNGYGQGRGRGGSGPMRGGFGGRGGGGYCGGWCWG
ncbi:MAG: hypothetical protein LBG91_05275 [Treponema sp.]|jgi:hypothetical protein|nr:hypothetical protein [Treponema sp.]